MNFNDRKRRNERSAFIDSLFLMMFFYIMISFVAIILAKVDLI